MLQQGESGIAGGNIKTLVLFILQISRDSTPFIEYHPFQLSAYDVAYIYPASIYLSTLLLQGALWVVTAQRLSPALECNISHTAHRHPGADALPHYLAY